MVTEDVSSVVELEKKVIEVMVSLQINHVIIVVVQEFVRYVEEKALYNFLLYLYYSPITVE